MSLRATATTRVFPVLPLASSPSLKHLNIGLLLMGVQKQGQVFLFAVSHQWQRIRVVCEIRGWFVFWGFLDWFF